MDEDLIVLLKETGKNDSEGYFISNMRRHEVFAKIKSVGRTEFYQSMRSGVKLSATFEIEASEYDAESLIEYNGKTYNVERSFNVTLDVIQLNCSEVVRNVGA